MTNFQREIDAHYSFWAAHPAVLIGISFLVGIATALFSLPLYLSILLSLYLVALRKWAALSAILMAVIYSILLYGSPPTPTNLCRGRFSISSIQPHQTPFNSTLLYKGILYIDSTAVPCSISANHKERKRADRDYLLTGALQMRNPYDYIFKPKNWEEIDNTYSLAELRYKSKTKLRDYLFENLPTRKAASLLTSLVTGVVDDRLLRFEFGRLGLQHILAISGFHFGILIAFLSLLLRFLPLRIQWGSMILLTTTYFIFIGDSPAVARAYIVTVLFLFAKLIHRPTTPINLLGSALFIELIFNPLIATNLGFQFSFGSCFGILLLYKPLEIRFRKFFPARPSHKTVRLSFFEGLMYLVSSSFRNSLSLSLAVNITLLPLLFLHFGKFPLLSLLYNLFFPFLITINMFLLLSTLLFSVLIPALRGTLFSLLDIFTSNVLDLTSYPPLLLDHSLYFQEISTHFIPLYLFAILCFSIRAKNLNLQYP